VVSAKGDILVASTRAGIVEVRTKDWTRIGNLDDLEGGFYGASADLKTMFLGTFGTFERIDTARMKKLPPLSGATEKRTPECVAVSADGSRVAAVLSEQKGRPRLYRWETTTAAPAIQALFENDDRWACTFASNGALVVGTDLGTYVVTKDGKAKKLNGRSIWRIEADPKKPRVAFADTDEKIALLDLTTGAVREIGSHLDNIDELAFSPSGERLASASQDDSVVVWDVR
jgi:WD40 repeat protein